MQRLFFRSGLRLTVLFAALMLAACQTPSPQNKFSEITFKHLSPIKLDVRTIDVDQTYRQSNQHPNVEHLFPVNPAQVVARWPRDRLQAAGPSGSARFIVHNASAVEIPLKTKTGLKGIATIDQSERYVAKMTVELQIMDDTGRIEGTVTAEAERSITVDEKASLNEREKVWFKLTEDIMRDLDAQLEKTIKEILFKYVLI